MAGRFPGARNIPELWRNLRAGHESVTFFTEAELARSEANQSLAGRPGFVPARATLDDIELFDAAFFGYTPREAECTDPQQRFFLESAWAALEDSGYSPSSCPERCGVYAGSGLNTYLLRNLLRGGGLDEAEDEYLILIGNDKDFLPTRVSYQLGLQGPSVAVSTACSTSLVVVHMACHALITYQCDMALAGGVTVRCPQTEGYLHQAGGILSEDGHCRPFDASASGTVGGSGVGVVVLKRLEDALEDGDPVRAVILGSAVNNDGSDKVGFAAPGIAGQARVIAEAQAMAGVEPDDITYVEAHGTGTPLGDPIEVAALTRAFRLGTRRTGFCALGSVKSNLGHLDTAAGIAGLIKTVLSLEAGEIPASLHYREPNPEIDFATSPFFVNAELRPWHSEGPRRAGVSSFGLGGTNAHVVLGEAPSRPASGTSRPVQILTLSAKTGSALESATDRLRDHLAGHPQTPLADVAHTLQIGRQTFAHRRVVLCRDVSQAVTSLGDVDAADVFTGVAQGGMPEVAMLFSGQGAQFAGMGRGLYRDEPVFRKCMDRCFDELGELGRELADGYSNPDWPATWLVHTSYVQPLLFSVEYSLAQLWRSWGILPSALAGHSLGELVAACVAEVMSLSDALALVALRGRLMHDSPAGGMLAVSLGEQQLTDRLPEDLDLAAVNGPESTVVAGGVEALERFAAELTADDVASVRLLTNRPFHSRTMDEVADELVRHLAGVDLRPPKIPLLSNVTGGWMQSDEATDPASWGLQVRQPVQFSGALERLLEAPDRVLLEVGPGRVLCGLARRHTGCTAGRLVLPSMLEGKDETEQMLRGLGQLWLSGVDVDWSQFSAGERRHKVALPTYPFERRRYWINAPRDVNESIASRLPSTPEADALAKRDDVSDWYWMPSWKRMAPAVPSRRRSRFLLVESAAVMGGPSNLGQLLAEELQIAGHDVAPTTAEGLLEALEAAGETPTVIVHLSSASIPAAPEPTSARVAAAQDEGFFDLLAITRALAGRAERLPVRLDVISTGLQDVTGTEMLEPEKATLLGPVRVIPQEHPEVACRSIDLEPSGHGSWTDHDVANLVAELTSEVEAGEPAILALRHGHRWSLHYEPMPLGAADSDGASDPYHVSGLRNRGVYLITGGLGGIGLEIARHLATTVDAKLVLTARTPLPAREDWQGIVDGRPALRLDLTTDADFVHRRIRTLEREMAIRAVDDYPNLPERLTELCANIALHYVASGCGDPGADTTYDLDAVKRRLGVLPKYDRFFAYLVSLLEQGGLARVEGDCLNLQSSSEPTPPHELARRICEDHPGFRPLIEFLMRCSDQYPAVLAGEIEALEVLYPQGSAALIKSVAEETVEHVPYRLYQTAVHDLVARVLAAHPGRKLRILEVGAGTGALTRSVLPALEGADVEYFFTDIGKAFVEEARHTLDPAHDGLSFHVFDVSRDPESQGIELESFDMILELDVVHATPHVTDTLRRLRGLLRPGGLLALLETVRSRPWSNMVYGLAEGWWIYEDRDLRSDSPLLGADAWVDVLASCGFETALAFPRDPVARANADCALIVAQNPGIATASPDSTFEVDPRTAHRIEHVLELERLGAEVLTMAVDVSDEDGMREVVSAAEKRFGPIHGVIQAAAIERRGPITLRSPEALADEFTAKLYGTLAIDRLFRDREIDFVLHSSSITSILGGVGDVEYAASNAFVDAYALWAARSPGPRTLAVNWDRWQRVGMAKAFEARHREVKDSTLIGGMTRAEGREVFARVVAGATVPQVVVSTVDFEAWRELARAHDLESLIEKATTRPSSSRPELATPFRPPESDMQRTVAAIWCEVLGIENVGLEDDFSELGGDSLLALKITSRLRDNLQIDLTPRVLYEQPTVAALADHVETLRWAAEGARTSQTSDPLLLEEGSI